MQSIASQCICFRIVICLAFQESKPPTAEEVDEFIRHNKVDAKVSDLLWWGFAAESFDGVWYAHAGTVQIRIADPRVLES